jgi:hypothetical protein
MSLYKILGLVWTDRMTMYEGQSEQIMTGIERDGYRSCNVVEPHQRTRAPTGAYHRSEMLYHSAVFPQHHQLTGLPIICNHRLNLYLYDFTLEECEHHDKFHKRILGLIVST